MLPQLFWFRAVRLNQTRRIADLPRRHHRHVVRTLHHRRGRLHRSHLPSSWGIYHATIWDWLTMAGTVGFFFFGILLVVRFLPVMSMFEMRELVAPRRTA